MTRHKDKARHRPREGSEAVTLLLALYHERTAVLDHTTIPGWVALAHGGPLREPGLALYRRRTLLEWLRAVVAAAGRSGHPDRHAREAAWRWIGRDELTGGDWLALAVFCHKAKLYPEEGSGLEEL
jgi:hypothetical protein